MIIVSTLKIHAGIAVMRGVVRKWGNSAAVRIPASVLESSGLCFDAEVDVREEDGRVVIEPLEAAEYALAALVDKITPNNLHEEISFGRAVGKEAFS
jgi:antitoxin MazE